MDYKVRAGSFIRSAFKLTGKNFHITLMFLQ